MLRTLTATRYVVPLREGGSLPAVLDTEGGGLFVAKFRGAGQGARALVAEILVAGIARVLDLPVPEIALIELDESFGRSERDPEIQDLLRASTGINFGIRYLEGALNFDAAADAVDADLAARIVWLDAFTSNLDRTDRNPNMMWWNGAVWLIDHGAALYFHHDWPEVDANRARTAFPAIRDHVLLPQASSLEAVDAILAGALDEAALDGILAAVPDALLMDAPAGGTAPFASAAANRAAYLQYFRSRLQAPRTFAVMAEETRQQARGGVPVRKDYRR